MPGPTVVGLGRKSISQLFWQGCHEIPEVMGSTVIAFIGIGLGIAGCYRYVKEDHDNRRYKMTYVVMRPDDPRVAKIRKD